MVLPFDYPKKEFDRPINFHRLLDEAVEFLEKSGMHARRVTPLFADNYGYLFARKGNSIVDEQTIEKFFSHFIDCLLVETQTIINRQYYYGLGFYKQQISIMDFLSMLPAELQEGFSKPDY